MKQLKEKDYCQLITNLTNEIVNLIIEGNLDPFVIVCDFVYTVDQNRHKLKSLGK